MRKVGEILKSERIRQGKSLEEIAVKTKLRVDFLEELENGNYQLLPDDVYIRGFINSYSNALNLDPKQTLPFYKREMSDQLKHINNQSSPQRMNRPIIELNPLRLVTGLLSIGILAFIIIMVIQFSRFQGAPVLIIDSPSENMTSSTSTINIAGQSEVGAKVTINGEEVSLSITGKFYLVYSLKEGVNYIIIVSEDNNEHQTKIERVIEYKRE